MCRTGQRFEYASWHPAAVRIKDLTPELFLSIPCPTCNVAAEKPCVLYGMDRLRSEPHVDRKLAAIEAIEENGPEIGGKPRQRE